MRRVGLVLSALLLLVGALIPAFAQGQPFADVPTDHWAYNSVNRLAEAGVLEGYPDGTFKGKQSLTRYEFAQAIARMLDRVEQMTGQVGPGIPGPTGPQGPAGPGLTPEQQALLNRLAKEFAPELQALRSDLNALTKRVEDLEARPGAKPPTITVSGSLSWRTGVYGNNLGFEEVETTGYPFPLMDFGEATAAFGGINIPDIDSAGNPTGEYVAVIPISDALKDAYKAADFMTMRNYVNLTGSLAENTNVKVSLRTGPRTNLIQPEPLDVESILGSPNLLTGNGIMDTVQIDEAWVNYKTNLIAPLDVTVGKQYKSRGLGLLFCNNQEAIKAIDLDWQAGAFGIGALLGMLDREQFFGRTADSIGTVSAFYGGAIPGYPFELNGQDNINLVYVDVPVGENWNIGGNWLQSGFNQEQGWSASVAGKFMGLDLYGEYAKLLKWPNGEDFADTNGNDVEDAADLKLDESDTAWLAGLKWKSPSLVLTGEYGQVDPGYAIAFTGGGWSPIFPVLEPLVSGHLNLPLSQLHPRAEIDPHDINWIDRMLFLDATNIARGWHVGLELPNLLGKDTPVCISYAAGDAYNPAHLSWLALGGSGSGIVEPDKWRDADAVWMVKVGRKLSNDISANILYGRRQTENVMSRREMAAGLDAQQQPVYAPDDDIQVIRAELVVSF